MTTDDLLTLYSGDDAVVTFDPRYQLVLVTLASGKTLVREADREQAERVAASARRGGFSPAVDVVAAAKLGRPAQRLN